MPEKPECCVDCLFLVLKSLRIIKRVVMKEGQCTMCEIVSQRQNKQDNGYSADK